MSEPEEQNDAIAQVDCKIFNPCCDNPKFINQFGSRTCVCKNCGRRCNKCTGDYIKK